MKDVGNIIGVIGLIFIIIVSIYLNRNQDEIRNNAFCKEYSEFLDYEIYARIEKKFQDSDHHNNETIIANEFKIVFAQDRSGFYKFVQEGDSLSKEKGNSKIEVFRQGQHIRTFKIDLGCNEKSD